MSHQWCPRQWLSSQAFCLTTARELPSHASAGANTALFCSRTRRLGIPAAFGSLSFAHVVTHAIVIENALLCGISIKTPSCKVLL